MLACKTTGKYDQAVSLARVLAMAFIVLCHIGGYLGCAAMAQFFNVGVPLFLLISGYLYGQKTIPCWKHFFYKRWRTLLVPVYIWLAVLVAAAWGWAGELPRWQEVLPLLLNLQGIGFLTDRYASCGAYPGLGHLWFLTVLMLCYVLVLPLLQACRGHMGSKRLCWFVWLALLLLSLAAPAMAGIHAHYFLVFALGYGLSGEKKLTSIPSVWLWILLACLACLLRVVGKWMYDGTYLYEQVIVVATHIVLAASIFVCIQKLYGCYPRVQDIVSRPWIGGGILHLDKGSYAIYLTHYVFLTGIFSAEALFPGNNIVGIMYALSLSAISAFCLKKVSDKALSFFPASRT